MALNPRYVFILLLMSLVLTSCSSGSDPSQNTPSQTKTAISTYPVAQTTAPARTDDLCFLESYGIECTFVFELPMAAAGIYAISPDGDLWTVWTENPRSDNFISWLVHLTTDGMLEKIPLQIGATDLQVTDSSIWILNMTLLPEIPKLVQLDLNGNLISEYDIPREFLLDADGQYQEFGVSNLYLGANGEFFLGGVTGMWRLLDEHGKLSPRRLDGLPCGETVCTVDSSALDDTQIAYLQIGEKRIDFVTESDGIYLLLHSATPDGGIWVSAVETNRVGIISQPRQSTLYRFNSAGEEVGHVVFEASSVFVDGDGILYQAVIKENVTYVYRLDIEK